LALATAAVGILAFGYLIPALCLVLAAALLWFGKGGGLLKALSLVNLLSGAVLILALAVGGAFGMRKLDLSGAALVANLFTGGPGMGLIAFPLLSAMRPGRRLANWFREGAQ